MSRYLGTPDEWERLHKYLLTQDEVGVDTESQEAEEGYSGSRDLYVWSIAGFRPGAKMHPRGYHPAAGYCLPGAALETFRPLLESEKVIKWVHNAPADTRPIFDNSGIVLRKARCTLQYSRVTLPNAGAFGLKFLASACLGKPEREGYLDVISYPFVHHKVKKEVEAFPCTCGVPKCKKRKGHYRMKLRHFRYRQKVDMLRYNQADLVPGHERWERWVEYAIADAVDALELASFLNNRRCGRPGDPFGPTGLALAKEMYG